MMLHDSLFVNPWGSEVIAYLIWTPMVNSLVVGWAGFALPFSVTTDNGLHLSIQVASARGRNEDGGIEESACTPGR
jgi:hypothetical protein